VDVNGSNSHLRGSTADVVTARGPVEVRSDVGLAEELDADTNHERLATTYGIHEEERGQESATELGERIKGGRVDGGAAGADADVAKDGGEIVGDGVGAGHLGENVGGNGELDTAKVGADGEHLAGARNKSILSVLLQLAPDRLVDAVELGVQVGVVPAVATQAAQRLERLFGASDQTQPTRRFLGDKGHDKGDEGNEELNKPGSLPLEVLGVADVLVASIDDEDADGLATQHGEVEPQCHETAGKARGDLDNRHGTGNSQGAYADTGEQAANVETSDVAVCESLEENTGADDAAIDAERREAAKAVIEEEREEGADAAAQVDKGDDVGDRAGIGRGRDAKGVLEALEGGDG
jgi:hypothetical protein